MSLLTAELKSRVGETATYTAPDEIGRAAIRYYATAVGDDNPEYGDIAPPTMICETNQYVTGRSRDEDGYLGHSWHLDVPNTRLVRGGNDYTFFRHVRPIDVVTATWTIADMSERTTSSGTDMLVVTSEATYTRADGAVLATNTETLIFVALA